MNPQLASDADSCRLHHSSLKASALTMHFHLAIAWTMLNWLQAFQNRAGCWAAHRTYLSFSFPLPASLLITSSLVAVQVLSRVRLFVTPWTAALQASLSITVILSWFKFMSIESMMPSNHGIIHGCHPLLLLPSVFPSIKVFSNELALCIRWPKY